mgnify:CR=1 FL=1
MSVKIISNQKERNTVEKLANLNNKKTLYLLISESDVGYHSELDDAEFFIVFKMTFIPRVKLNSETGKYEPKISLTGNKTYNKIIKNYRNNKHFDDIKIFIGFDADENGELMAQALKEQLLFASVKPKDIYRTPLTEQGYMAITSFLNIDNYCKFRGLEQEFMERLKSKGIKPKGFRKILSVEMLNGKKKNEKTFEVNLESAEQDGIINTNGTSTYTFIQNKISESIKHD